MTSDTIRTSELADLEAEVEAQAPLRFETLLADLSARLINLPAGEIDHQIQDTQRLVCESLGLDVATLWQWQPENPWTLTLTHFYRPLSGPPVPQTMDAQDYFPWCQRQILAGNVVKVASLADVPAEASRDREVWSYYGIKTALTIPLSAGGGPVFGCVSFNHMKAKRRWSAALVQRLRLVAQIFANALARKQADQELRKSEQRLELAADAAALGLWSLNLATGRYWLTDKTRQLFVFSASEEITFERFLSLVHAEDQARVRQKVQKMVESRQEDQIEYRVVRPDGSLRWMLSRGRVQRNAGGDPDFLMGVTTDITQRKQAEQEAQELRNGLMHMTRVNSLGALSASLAHELNQPLGIILSNAQAAQDLLALDPPDLTEVQAILADIVAADRRAGEVIDGLRALLKRGEMSLRPLDLNEVIRQVLRLVQSDLLGRGVAVAHDLAPGLPPALGDRIQLQQLILNLLLNAADSVAQNPRGARRVHLRTQARQSFLRVSVRDEGSGLPADTEQLFQPFYTTKSHGLGLGLPICRFIADAHHGRVWAEPHPERGAVFHCEIPVATTPVNL